MPELVPIEQSLDLRLPDVGEHSHRGARWQFADVALVGRSPAMRNIAEVIARVARRGAPANVLLSGATGTGKGVIARAIHAHGPRRARPFVSVNCASVPDHLVESELFGHEAGAFTDAKFLKRGLFEIADQGTVFLDEIGDMSRPMQAKLLHVLESREFRRVGGVRTIKVDVHVLTATHHDLEVAIAAGTFRQDLYYRLNVIRVRVPPLHERPEDIAPLAQHFVDELCRDLGLPTRDIARDALQALERHDWPGNARELRNVLERVLLLDDGPDIALGALPQTLGGSHRDAPLTQPFVLPASGVNLEALERALLRQALERTAGNKTGAARLLGLSRDTLRYRLEKHGIC